MFPIHEVTAVESAFPANVLEFMPKMEDIPEEFKGFGSASDPIEVTFISDWFFSGIKKCDFTPKEGVDGSKALKHIQMILRSFEPKHEHKEAACAFLVREWFSDISYEKNEKKGEEDGTVK